MDAGAAVFVKSGAHVAQLKFAQLKEKAYQDPYFALQIAYQYGIAGEKNKVLEWLNQSLSDEDGDRFFSLNSAPEFDCVRSDPGFQRLVHRLGLSP